MTPPPLPATKLRVPRSTWLILGSGLLLGVWVGRYMWDFAAGYNGALLLRAGLNPYSLQPLLNYPAGHVIAWVYPPLGLRLFLPFTLLSYPAAINLWLGLELAGAALLAWVWTRHFWKFDLLTHPAAMLIVCFGLNGTLLWLLTTGNVGMVEAVLLWLALAALLNGHDKRYGVLIAMASILKVLPAFFVVAPLAAFPQPRWRAFGWGVICLVLLFALNPILFPAEWQQFRSLSAGGATAGTRGWQQVLDANLFQYERDSGADNTSALFFWRAALPAVGGWVAEKTGGFGQPGPYSDEQVYLLGCTAIAAISLFHILRYRQRPATFEPRLVILFLCLVFALLVPRMKPYSLVIAIAPVVYIYYRRRDAAQLGLLLGLALIPHYSESALPLPVVRLAKIAFDFLPLITVFVAWLLFLAEMRAKPHASASASSAESKLLVSEK